MSIGTRLKEVRKVKHLTINKMADVLSLSKGALSKIENNLSDPKASSLVSLSKQYGVNLNWLLTGQGTMFVEDGQPVQNNKLEELEAELRVLREQIASLEAECNDLGHKSKELNEELVDRLRELLGLQAELLKAKT